MSNVLDEQTIEGKNACILELSDALLCLYAYDAVVMKQKSRHQLSLQVKSTLYLLLVPNITNINIPYYCPNINCAHSARCINIKFEANSEGRKIPHSAPEPMYIHPGVHT